jgi:DNA primase large subunit
MIRKIFRKMQHFQCGGSRVTQKRLAKYPFLKESVQYLRDNGITLDDIVGHMAYERARLVGKERVLAVIEGGTIGDRPINNSMDQLTEFLSYPIARMLVSCIADDYLVKRYALAEGVSANQRLLDEPLDFIVAVAEEMEMDIEADGGEPSIHFTDYLRFTVQLRSLEAKLINQRMEGGYVLLTKARLCRIIQEGLQKRIEEELPLPVTEGLLESFSQYISELGEVLAEKKSQFKPKEMGKLRVARLPPCMRILLGKAHRTEYMSHPGRFALSSFLSNIGLAEEEIVSIFSSSADFDVSVAKYQVEHISGRISGTEYSSPKCKTMITYDLCPGGDSLCKKEWMTHPLTYYKVKGKKKQHKKGRDEKQGKGKKSKNEKAEKKQVQTS